jgi:hypothetical protein
MKQERHWLFRWLAVVCCFCLAAGLALAVTNAGADEEKKEETAKKKSSLADLARGSKESRQAETSRKYTNEDLKKAKGNITSSGDVAARPTAQPPDTDQAAAGEETVDQKYFKLIVTKVQQIQDLERRRDVEVLEYNRLRQLYANSPNGIYQNRTVKPEMDASFQKLEEMRRDVEKARAELEDLKTEARKNGVMPVTIRKAEEEGQKLPEPTVPSTIK